LEPTWDPPRSVTGTHSNNFTSGLKDAAISRAGSDATVATESVRQVADALSCVESLDFIGRASAPYTPRAGPGDEGAAGGASQPTAPSYHSMPVKLVFPDKDSRIYFEQTVKKNCGISAKINLPPTLRKVSSEFGESMRKKYPGMITVVKLEPKKRIFSLITKTHGERSWTKQSDTVVITPALLAGVTTNEPPITE